MKTKKPVTIKNALLVLVALAVYGLLVPFLLSQENTGLVLAGVGLIFAGIYGVLLKVQNALLDGPEKPRDGCSGQHGSCRHGLALLAVIGAGLLSQGCSVERVPPGHVGVKVHATGSDKGVDHEVVGVGYQFLTLNQQLYLFPTFQQNYTWTSEVTETNPVDEHLEFQTKEGMLCRANIGISYTIDPGQVSTIFQKYRRGVEEITDTFLRNHVRDALGDEASTLSVEDVYGSGKVGLIDRAQQRVSAEVGPYGIRVDKIYLIGAIQLPETVRLALDAKIKATQEAQQRENEVQKARAEAEIKIAQARGDAESALMRAKAEAEANQLKLRTLTAELIRYEAIQKWDGKLPQITGNTVPMIQLDKP